MDDILFFTVKKRFGAMKMAPKMRTINRYISADMKTVMGIPTNLPMANAPQKPNKRKIIKPLLFETMSALCTRSHVSSASRSGCPNVGRVCRHEAAVRAFNPGVHASERRHDGDDGPEQPGLHRLLVQRVVSMHAWFALRVGVIQSDGVAFLFEEWLLLVVFCFLFLIVLVCVFFLLLFVRWTEA